MGMLNQGPGYTVSDLVWWSGVLGGTVVAYTASNYLLELPRIACLVVGIGVGACTGFLAERLYSRSGRNRH